MINIKYSRVCMLEHGSEIFDVTLLLLELLNKLAYTEVECLFHFK